MTFIELKDTIGEILINENIIKEGLVLTYYIDTINHLKLDEELFYSNPDNKSKDFKNKDEIIIEVGGISVKILKKNKT